MNWYSNPDFWSLFYEWMFPAESFAEAGEQIGDIRRLSGIDTGSILDLCCGPGRHSIPLAQGGFDVTAVDLDAFLLSNAEEYATRENVAIEFVKADMRDFKRSDSFDLIVSMYSSFGYFEDPEEDINVLENCYHSLRSGGRILLDVRGKEIHAMQNPESISHEMPNGDLIFQKARVSDDWSSTNTTWVYIQGEQVHRFEVTYNLYSGVELIAILRKAGFSDVRIYGNLKGAPYNNRANRLVAVAGKK